MKIRSVTEVLKHNAWYVRLRTLCGLEFYSDPCNSLNEACCLSRRVRRDYHNHGIKSISDVFDFEGVLT